MNLTDDKQQAGLAATDIGFRAVLNDAPGETPLKKFNRPPEKTTWVTSTWDKNDYIRFTHFHSPARKEADAKDLKTLFNLAAKAPVMRQALDWAEAHDVDFIIDRTLSEKVLGYYTPGTGVVAISAALFDKTGVETEALLASVLTHETRHAWQDFKGISTSLGHRPAADYSIMVALIEADAMAHEQLAYAQYINNYRRGFGTEDKAAITAEIAKRERELEDPKFLWQQFKEWYGKRGVFYGDSAMQFAGSVRGVPGAKRKDFGVEFVAYGVGSRKGIDFTRPEELRKLGRSFTGKNYMDGAPREDFDRRFLSPSLSRQFFDAARPADPVAVALRKMELQEKKRKRDEERQRKLRNLPSGGKIIIGPGSVIKVIT